MKDAYRLLIGSVGDDIHSVGMALLTLAFREAGLVVSNLGIGNQLDDFFHLAPEVDAAQGQPVGMGVRLARHHATYRHAGEVGPGGFDDDVFVHPVLATGCGERFEVTVFDPVYGSLVDHPANIRHFKS